MKNIISQTNINDNIIFIVFKNKINIKTYKKILKKKIKYFKLDLLIIIIIRIKLEKFILSFI